MDHTHLKEFLLCISCNQTHEKYVDRTVIVCDEMHDFLDTNKLVLNIPKKMDITNQGKIMESIQKIYIRQEDAVTHMDEQVRFFVNKMPSLLYNIDYGLHTYEKQKPQNYKNMLMRPFTKLNTPNKNSFFKNIVHSIVLTY